MDVVRRLLDRAVDSVRLMLSQGPRVSPAPPAGVRDRLERVLRFLRQPCSVVHVLVFRDGELVYQQGYDPITGGPLTDPETAARRSAAVHAVLDFMRDAFGGGGNCVSFQIGRWWVVGVVEGQHTLVAMAGNVSSPDRVETWLQNFARSFPA